MRLVIPSLVAAVAVASPALASADDGVSVCNEAENSPRGGYVVTDGPVDPVPPAFLRGSQMRVGNGQTFTRHNLDAADEIMADEYVEHAIEPFGREEPGRVHGPSHAREVVEWLTSQFPDLEMTIQSLVSDADTVAVRVPASGSNRRKLGGFAPPTNKRFVAEQSHW